MDKQIVNARIVGTELARNQQNEFVVRLAVHSNTWNAPLEVSIKSIDDIVTIMNVVEVGRWEDIPGKFVRAELDVNEDGSGTLLAVGHILDELWFREEKEVSDTATDATTGEAVEAEEIQADKKD